MDRLNPVALGLWFFGASLGYAIADGHGLAIGLAIASGVTTAVSIFRGD
jgi:hypothetical protein